jgi:hypothetical protein
MHLSLEHGFDVTWGDHSQGEVLFTVSGTVEGDEVKGLKAEGFFEGKSGRDVRFDLSDLSKSQRMTCEELLLDEAERREKARAA